MSGGSGSLSEHIREIRASKPDIVFSDGDINSLEEGLGLLAAYTAISDRRTRLLLKKLVETVAHAKGTLGPYIVCDAPY